MGGNKLGIVEHWHGQGLLCVWAVEVVDAGGLSMISYLYQCVGERVQPFARKTLHLLNCDY